MEIYAPIANRLGMGAVKAELEDLAFRYLDQKRYGEIKEAIDQKMKVSRGVVEEIRSAIVARLDEVGLNTEVVGRVKSISSIHQKLTRQGIEIGRLYDYLAFRITTGSVQDCYAALGVVHQRWRPVPGRIKDYIAMPKPNFYQSLHTTVVGDNGSPFEIQIRTREMDLIAEQGIAAHWKYKEGRVELVDRRREFPLAPATRGVAARDQGSEVCSSTRSRSTSIRTRSTPSPRKGDVLRLPARSDPARLRVPDPYRPVGNRCVGARVNGKLVQLRSIPPQRRHCRDSSPRAEPEAEPRVAESLVVTSRARHKIRHWLNTEQKTHSIELGRKLVEKEARKFRVPIRKLIAENALDGVLAEHSYARIDDLYADVGYGKLSARSVVERFFPDDDKRAEEQPSVFRDAVRKIFPFGGSPPIKVKGSDDLMTYLAKCCNPLPGEEIVGYVTRGKGVAVHSVSCPNVRNLMFNPDREIAVEWGEKEPAHYRIDLEVRIEDRTGMLARVVSQIANLKTNIRNIEARTADGRGAIDLTVEISDLRHLEKVIKGISNLDGVIEVQRKYNARQATA
jgi:GTP diphosphokinase / guanosine-3',5'-bis(diphosphate) 3'-diphosphatase